MTLINKLSVWYKQLGIVLQGCLLTISLFMSLSIVLTKNIHIKERRLEDIWISFTMNDMVLFIFVTILCFFIFILFSYASQRYSLYVQSSTYKRKLKITYVAVILFVAWLPTFFTFFPGTLMHDEIFAMHSPRGTSNQPVLYSLILSCFYRIGLWVGHPSWSVAILNLVEMGLMAWGVSYCIVWVHKKGFQRISYLLILYFICLPIISDIAVTFLKDKLFSVAMLVSIPLLYDLYTRLSKNSLESKYYLKYLLYWGLFITLFRSNGLYVYLVVTIFLLAWNSKYRKSIAKQAMIVLVISLVPSTIFHITVPFQEAVGIPIQQVAYVLKNDGTVDERSQKYLSSLLPIEQWKDKYNPENVDPIKWDNQFQRHKLDETKSEFLLSWGKIVIHNPKLSVEAWLLQTYGVWSFTPFPWPGSQSVIVAAATDEILQLRNPLGKVNDRFIIGNLSDSFIEGQTFWGKIIYGYSWYFGTGTCFWISMLFFLSCICQKEKRKIFVFLPFMACWLTLMISCPYAFVFRYAYMYPLGLPFLLLIPFLKISDE